MKAEGVAVLNVEADCRDRFFGRMGIYTSKLPPPPLASNRRDGYATNGPMAMTEEFAHRRCSLDFVG